MTQGKARVLAINDAYRLAPWADALYACDHKWWQAHAGVPGFAGLKITHSADAAREFGIARVAGRGAPGLSFDPAFIHLGSNGGYQALNLAVLFGCARILLLGYDMQPTGGLSHWFGDHPEQCRARSNYTKWIANFATTLPDLERAGVEVINCSRATALTCFRRSTLEAELT